ncbi:MAG: hypothetical protein ACFFFG_06495 [Candidatus Thorarchaeota archaeon]
MTETKMNRAQGKPYDEILSEIQTVLGKDNARIMAQVGLNLGKRWGKAQKGKSRKPKTLLELWEWIADYLENDLFVANPIQVKQENPGQYHIKYGVFDSDKNQCRLCVGI